MVMCVVGCELRGGTVDGCYARHSTAMRHILAFRSAADCLYDGGPIIQNGPRKSSPDP